MVSYRAGYGVTLGYLAVYVVAVLTGLSFMGDNGLAYFWPAAGVGTLWMLRGRRPGQVAVDGALLLTSTVVIDAAMGISFPAALLFGLANLTIGLTVRLSSALVEGLPFTGRLPRRVAGKRDLGQLGGAALLASLVSAPFGLSAAQVSSGSVTWATAAAWVARNTCSTFVVVASVLALLTAMFRSHARRGWAQRLSATRRRFWWVELGIALVVSVGTAVFIFAAPQTQPIAFLLIVPATWLGYRFTPVVAGLYAMFVSALTVLCTQAGRGPFSSIEDLTARAVTVQIYALVLAVLLLVLSTGVAEREALIGRVVESEARATSRAELLDAVMNSITDGLVVLEPSGAVMMGNPAAEELGGNRRAPGTMGTAEEHGLFHGDGTPFEPGELPHVRALAGELVTSEELLRIDPDTGLQVNLSVSALPLRQTEESGGPLTVLVIHDVTKERSQRRELEAFAGTVAHDLKAPLTGVGSWAEILDDQLDALGVDVTEPKTSLRRIQSSAVRMQQLIADLLDYSQAQSQPLKPIPLSLTAMVEDVARHLREASSGTPPLIEHGPLGTVMADRMLVSQLLANVLGNAVKYVAPGTRPRVHISCRVVGDMVEIRVADNGIGIPRAERGRIFDSFYRASSSGEYPGTGLGLAICARAVERHGGRISAREGLEGRGTTMIFTLPADPDAPSADEDAESPTMTMLAPGQSSRERLTARG